MRSRQTYLYCIKPVGLDGPIKIGMSANPAARKTNVAAWSPFPLEVIASMPAPRNIEGRIHALLASHHSHCEWFRATHEVLGVVKQIAAGTLDFNSLPEESGAIRHLKKRLATFSKIDWEYTRLWENERHYRYVARDAGLPVTNTYPPAPSAFHLFSDRKKQAVLADIRHDIALGKSVMDLAA